jgi:hypothetical protein
MSRALVILNSRADREKASGWIAKAPPGTRVTFQAARRSIDQNSKLWACLTDVAEQATHAGKRYTPDEWKILFMAACQKEVQVVPSLDGKSFVPWGYSSSKLSKDEMSEFLEFIIAWGAENGVRFHDEKETEAA